MLGYLADIASDLSVFHRVDDAGQMEAAVFFSLATRLPAYDGVLAARWRSETGPTQQRGHSGRGSGRGTYEAGSGQANIAATASSAPPATRTQLMLLNSQLGGNFFSTAVVKKSG